MGGVRPVRPVRRAALFRRATRERFLTLLSLATLAAALAVFSTAALAAPPIPTPPSCTVTLDSVLQTAKPTSTLGTVLDFSGSINVTTGTTNPRSLAIVAEITPDRWAANVAPTSENITDGEQVRFNSTVAVPPAELASTRGTLTVRASFLAVPGIAGSLVECAGQSTIAVAQYYAVDIDTSHPRVDANSGAAGVEATVIVHNLGNGRDTFTLDLEDRLFVQDVHLFTNLPQRITLDAGAESNLSFTINATSEAKPDPYDLAVVLRSDAQPQTAVDNLVFTVVVKETIIQSLIPDVTGLIILSAIAGSGLSALVLRRRAKRRREAREARRKLQKVLRLRREGEEGGYGEEVPGGLAQGNFPEAVSEPASDPSPAPSGASPERMRVKVKGPPRS